MPLSSGPPICVNRNLYNFQLYYGEISTWYQLGRGDDRVKNQFLNPFYISKFSSTVFVDLFSFEFLGTFNLERSDDLSPT